MPVVVEREVPVELAGTVALTISTCARLVFVNVQTIVSPGSTSSVAVAP